MSKLSFSLLFVVLIGCIYQVTAFGWSDFDGKQCVLKKSYSDGCNQCVCANNIQDDSGVWKPIIYCTLKMCYTDEKAYTPVGPPEDFWQS
ncbi:hypothetical protein TSAR_001944 [Trichomalopsis sarcophagae]|uniref:Pacifastin domain-containing protein n=1 Tax=Trichomalopsis sarcophagae TaxID=543379 RepID=A0A232FDD5_9HYME|nr:hypothetical protein TSAR_001944 [Trichomalopsis sarcophagae]